MDNTERRAKINTQGWRELYDAANRTGFVCLPEAGGLVWDAIPALLDELDAKDKELDRLTAENARLGARAEAAEGDIQMIGDMACQQVGSPCNYCLRGEDCHGDGFEWRGPQAEKGEGQ